MRPVQTSTRQAPSGLVEKERDQARGGGVAGRGVLVLHGAAAVTMPPDDKEAVL
jgi:hypothetical protein